MGIPFELSLSAAASSPPVSTTLTAVHSSDGKAHLSRQTRAPADGNRVDDRVLEGHRAPKPHDGSGDVHTASRIPLPANGMSDRDRQQCVDPTAVKHHSLTRELPAATIASDPIEVTAGAENRHLAVLHCAHNQEIRHEIDVVRSLHRIAHDPY